MLILIASAHGLIAADDALMDHYYPNRTKTVLEQAEEFGCQKLLCGRIKIKDGQLQHVRAWFKTLQQRQKELLEAFAAEGVHLESVFLEKAADGDHLIYYMRQNDLATVYQVLAQLQLPVRLFHVDCWKAYCEECLVLEPLFDLQLQGAPP
ncbi:MAG: DUF6176 family protein [Parachlamydia sp.]|nr:DUF6176 family protein [Parachlamydia sp.]